MLPASLRTGTTTQTPGIVSPTLALARSLALPARSIGVTGVIRRAAADGALLLLLPLMAEAFSVAWMALRRTDLIRCSEGPGSALTCSSAVAANTRRRAANQLR